MHQLKNPQIEVTIKFVDKKATYDEKEVLVVTFKESAPLDVDHIKYAKQRIKEELDRQQTIYEHNAGYEKKEVTKDPLEY